MAALLCSTCLTVTKTPDVNIGKSTRCPKCNEPGKIVSHEDSDTTTGELTLTSGQSLSFNAIYMVPLRYLEELNALYAEAAKKLTPKSSGLGFMGDIGFVVASSLAVGAVEGILNRTSANAGENLLAVYSQKRLALRYAGRFCGVGSIKQIQFPDPSLWASSQIEKGRDVTYAMTDDPFVCLQGLDGKPTSVRWSCVARYWVEMVK